MNQKQLDEALEKLRDEYRAAKTVGEHKLIIARANYLKKKMLENIDAPPTVHEENNAYEYWKAIQKGEA